MALNKKLLYRGIEVSYETIRIWCYKFDKDFEKVIKKSKGKFCLINHSLVCNLKT